MELEQFIELIEKMLPENLVCQGCDPYENHDILISNHVKTEEGNYFVNAFHIPYDWSDEDIDDYRDNMIQNLIEKWKENTQLAAHYSDDNWDY